MCHYTSYEACTHTAAPAASCSSSWMLFFFFFRKRACMITVMQTLQTNCAPKLWSAITAIIAFETGWHVVDFVVLHHSFLQNLPAVSEAGGRNRLDHESMIKTPMRNTNLNPEMYSLDQTTNLALPIQNQHTNSEHKTQSRVQTNIRELSMGDATRCERQN